MLRLIKSGLLVLVFSNLVLLGLFAIYPSTIHAVTGADWKPGNIIDDSIFYDNTTMGTPDIQNFLNSKVPTCDTWGTKPSEWGGGTRAQYGTSKGYPPPYTCLKDYSQDGKSAAQIIKESADTYGISPKSLIVLLQKEQALVTDEWPWPIQYRSATGYGCPDTAPCDAEYYGFKNQVMKAAYQFRRYATYPTEYRYKPYQVNSIQFNPNVGCGSTNVVIENLATAGLYNYTPYQPNASALSNLYGTGDSCGAYGNRNFWRLFNDWFGTTVSNTCRYKTPESVIASVNFRKFKPNVDYGNLTIYTGTSTNCIESHTWGSNFTTWQDHVATNQETISPAQGVVKYADLNGDGIDDPVLITYKDTSSGMVEFHVWNTGMRKWVVHAVSNLPSNLQNVSIEFCDFDGDGIDDPVAIGYSSTESGMVELHVWNTGVKSWKYHIITNLPVINPAEMNIGFADIDGDGKDEAIAIGLSTTSSSKVELHIWNPGLWSWKSHVVTNLPVFTTGDLSIGFADIDGDKKDEGIVIGHHNTSSGRIEFHVWNSDLSSWRSHSISNQIVL